jgi:hypothetical protein
MLPNNMIGPARTVTVTNWPCAHGQWPSRRNRATVRSVTRSSPRFPIRPVANQIPVRQQHARCPLVGAEHPDRLAGLHEHRFVGLQCLQGPRDGVECLPAARPYQCRRRPPGRPAAPRPRGRGCSSACAAHPLAASPDSSARCRGARTVLVPAGELLTIEPPVVRDRASMTTPQDPCEQPCRQDFSDPRHCVGPGARRSGGPAIYTAYL